MYLCGMSRKTITAALPYANGPVHIGHLAGVYVPADIYARTLRMMGEELLFICGSDEHGVPITLRARKEGITPQDVVDRYHKIIGDSFQDLGISFDTYSRTTSAAHKQTSQEFFSNLLEKGALDVQVSEQYFDPETQQFLADRYIVGSCPKCSAEGAYGDQCEKCGSTLSPDELVNPKSALSGAEPIKKETRNWYLPLDRLQSEFLNEYIGSRQNWKSNVLGQCKSWLNDGLKPRAMTRDLEWGIPVPVEGADGKVLYVWFEAPIGYISATRELRPDDWESWWTGDSEVIHFIGKDNIVFHCIIFPAMLHVRGDNYCVPSQVPANEFLNLEGQKISTSRNWAVWLHEYLQELPNRQDELRYVLTAIAPETKDSEFTWKDYQTRVNSELVGILGNFANRVLVLLQKYNNGVIPEVSDQAQAWMDASNYSWSIEDLWSKRIAPIAQSIQEYRFRDAQFAMMELARYGNKFLADLEPWKKVKEDPEAASAVLARAVQILYNTALAMEPFMPFASQRLLDQLNAQPSAESKKAFWLSQAQTLAAGHSIAQPSLLFQRVEDELVEQQMAKLQASLAAGSAAPAASAQPATPAYKPMIQYDDFAKLDLRVATVNHCERVPKADKLLKLELQVGEEIRTVLSGIAQHFEPEAVIGKQVLYLANLAPRVMRGIESQGMILMAEDAEGKLHFMRPDQAVNSGAGVA